MLVASYPVLDGTRLICHIPFAVTLPFLAFFQIFWCPIIFLDNQGDRENLVLYMRGQRKLSTHKIKMTHWYAPLVTEPDEAPGATCCMTLMPFPVTISM